MGKKGKNKSAAVTVTENSPKIEPAVEEKPKVEKETIPIVSELKEKPEEKTTTAAIASDRNGENTDQGTLSKKKRNNKKSKKFKSLTVGVCNEFVAMS